MTDFVIRPLTAADVRAHLPALVALLRDVVDGGSSVNFIAPLADEVAQTFWERVSREAEAGERIVLGAWDGEGLAGCVHLVLATQPNGCYRAEVQKLLVHSRFRRRGIAAALMRAAEAAARAAGRRLIVLDTERGSDAERLYARLGYERAGIIPQFALRYDGSALIDTVIFYRLL